MLAFELATLGQDLQYERRGRERESEADNASGYRREPEQVGGCAKQKRAQKHLRQPESENDASHDPQACGLQLQSDHEQQQHDSEVRDMRDACTVLDQAQSPRTDDESRGHITQDRAQVDEPEQRNRYDSGGQEDSGLGE